MRGRAFLTVALATVLAASACAPGTPEEGLIAITGGIVYPVSSEPIPGGTVVIRDGKIEALGADVSVPAGAEVIDATGMSVIPGIGREPFPHRVQGAQHPGDGSEQQRTLGPDQCPRAGDRRARLGRPRFCADVGLGNYHPEHHHRQPEPQQRPGGPGQVTGRHRRGHVLRSRRYQDGDPGHHAVSRLPGDRAGGLRTAERRDSRPPRNTSTPSPPTRRIRRTRDPRGT